MVSECCSIKLLSYILREKIYLYYSVGFGQPREPALCQLFRHTFVPYWFWHRGSGERVDDWEGHRRPGISLWRPRVNRSVSLSAFGLTAQPTEMSTPPTLSTFLMGYDTVAAGSRSSDVAWLDEVCWRPIGSNGNFRKTCTLWKILYVSVCDVQKNPDACWWLRETFWHKTASPSRITDRSVVFASWRQCGSLCTELVGPTWIFRG